MSTSLEQKIDDFSNFAKRYADENVTIDELYDRWREEAFQDIDARAVQASLRDMQQGETGRPFDEFADEFRQRNNIKDTP